MINKFVKKIKKWNWNSFFMIILLSCIGFLSNKSIVNTIDCFILAACFGIPVGLIFAWMSKDVD